MTSPLGMAVGLFLNVCHFDYTTVAVSRKFERSLTGLATPIAWMLSVTSANDRPKLVPQLPYNRMYITFKISKFSPYFEVQDILIWSDCKKVFHLILD